MENITTIVIIASLIAVLAVTMNGAILLGISRIFSVPISYNRSVLLSILNSTATGFFTVGFGVLGSKLIGFLVGFVIGFLIVWLLYKKYYMLSVAKSSAIYITYSIVSAFVGLLFTFALVLPIRMYFYEPVVIKGLSMTPLYKNGDYLVVKKWDKDIQRDDVIVFKTPSSLYMIQRVVGLPGESISITDGKLFINGKQYESKFIHGLFKAEHKVDLDSEQYFLLGDNIENSADSRLLGPIKFSQIVGELRR